VLSNGEFGSRLIDQARRFKLDFEALEYAWGAPLDLAAVKKRLGKKPAPGWLWCTHCETSTGVLNDLAALKTLCADRGAKLCVDGISSIGTLPVDLAGVYLASCASGKGLRAYPGLSMVFHHHDVSPAPGRLPRYLDLGYYAQQQGIPFTFSSNLLHALRAAVRHVDWKKRFAEVAELSVWLRASLVESGFVLVGQNTRTSPAVITIALPPEMDSVKISAAMQEAGYLLSYSSDYLRPRNWIQVCLMGEGSREKVVSLLNTLNRTCGRRRPVATPSATVSPAVIAGSASFSRRAPSASPP
jgi:aspartate aminotransferase-like enzyme